jgi:hypothetical protein
MIGNSPPLQADDILSYLEFIAAVKKLWEDSHPGIPVVPIQGPQFANYPVITYSLDIRRPHSDEPKRKMREQYTPTGGTDIRTIYGQRFLSIVRFTVIDPLPKKADAIIEAFEDFMVEYTPILKRLGASELTYGDVIKTMKRTSQEKMYPKGQWRTPLLQRNYMKLLLEKLIKLSWM